MTRKVENKEQTARKELENLWKHAQTARKRLARKELEDFRKKEQTARKRLESFTLDSLNTRRGVSQSKGTRELSEQGASCSKETKEFRKII